MEPDRSFSHLRADVRPRGFFASTPKGWSATILALSAPPTSRLLQRDLTSPGNQSRPFRNKWPRREILGVPGLRYQWERCPVTEPRGQEGAVWLRLGWP